MIQYSFFKWGGFVAIARWMRGTVLDLIQKWCSSLWSTAAASGLISKLDHSMSLHEAIGSCIFSKEVWHAKERVWTLLSYPDRAWSHLFAYTKKGVVKMFALTYLKKTGVLASTLVQLGPLILWCKDNIYTHYGQFK